MDDVQSADDQSGNHIIFDYVVKIFVYYGSIKRIYSLSIITTEYTLSS